MSSYLERSATVLRQICNEDQRTIARVTAKPRSLSPDGCDDDVWLVWHKLAVVWPNKANYDYTEKQIVWAWRTVRQGRARDDRIGLGGPRAEARRRRRQALRKLSAELDGQAVDLLGLDLADYSGADCTLAVAHGVRRDLVQLSESSVHAIDHWLNVRGPRGGGLFDLPDLPAYREESFSDHPEALAAASRIDPAAQVEQEELIERICAEKGPLACAFVLKNMGDRGGDWSVDLISRVARQCGPLAGHSFTKCERRTTSKALKKSKYLGAAD